MPIANARSKRAGPCAWPCPCGPGRVGVAPEMSADSLEAAAEDLQEQIKGICDRFALAGLLKFSEQFAESAGLPY